MVKDRELSQFWYDVEEAYRQVAINHEKEVTVARDGKKAFVYGVPYESDPFVAIHISEAQTETKDELPVP